MILNPDTYRSNLLAYTTLAYNVLPRTQKPSILDAGCGTGVPTIHLAEISEGTIVAIDINPQALAVLAGKVADKGLSHRITLKQCAIEMLPFDRDSFDIVWAEGSIAHLGFTTAGEILGKHLKPGGFLVIHDDAGDFLQKLSAVPGMGFSLLGLLLLSEDVWWNEYYRHLGSAVADAGEATPPHTLSGIRKELELFRAEPNRFQSAFFIMKKT